MRHELAELQARLEAALACPPSGRVRDPDDPTVDISLITTDPLTKELKLPSCLLVDDEYNEVVDNCFSWHIIRGNGKDIEFYPIHVVLPRRPLCSAVAAPTRCRGIDATPWRRRRAAVAASTRQRTDGSGQHPVLAPSSSPACQ
ncbi:hypothetical protein CLOM_g24176 [Closterium sp. NIES-68]|nr:hypothetical protein CLOM_g24176 [Closterium sp. NIES-68]